MATETLPFKAEVTQVLDLVIHSLYSHKEVFLRELLSNASDALDKLRFRALTTPELQAQLGDAPLEIRLIPDEAAGTLTIEDSGIGMTREELAQNLGTIAHSGSRRLLEELRKARAAGQAGADLTLIGQFGVGFYSAFLVADTVEVISRPAGGGAAHRWTSNARDGFTLEELESDLGRGTRIVLHLKESERHVASSHGWELRELVRRYSDYIAHPILLRVPAKEAAALPTWDKLNRGGALWQRPKSDISDAEYEELYKHLAHDLEGPLARTHFRVEGSQEFVGLLYIPRRAPFDLELQHRGVRLFVKRVFVMDDCTELLPEWLRFVRGVVDSDDLPLNVSREVLQDSAIVRGIRRQLVKKSLDLLEEIAKERPADYAQLWRTFGAILKGGLHLERASKDLTDRLAQLVRAPSTAGATSDVLTSLPEYVGRMKEGQEAIYYAVGDSADNLARSPHLEALKARGWEVLLFTDPVDEIALESLAQFQGKKLVSAFQASLGLPGAPASEAPTGPFGTLLGRMRALLQDHVSEVRASERLTESPVCLVVAPGGVSSYIERVLRQHGRAVPTQKRILEVNPGHPLIGRLALLAEKDPASPELAAHVELLFGQALLAEGSPLPDPHAFARRLTALLEKTAPAT